MKRLSTVTAGLLVAALALFGCTIPQYEPGWIALIDGEKGLENFVRNGDANWRAEDGAVVADKGGKVISTLVSKNSYRDFQLRVEFWVTEDTNSGIYIRISDPKKISGSTAYEVNIYDKRPGQNYGTGAIPNVAPVVHMPKTGGKWNTFEITAKGSNLVVVLNGERTINTYNSDFPSGNIAVQYGHGVVKVRKLEIKPL